MNQIISTVEIFGRAMVEYEEPKSYGGGMSAVIKQDGTLNVLNEYPSEIVAKSSRIQKASPTVPIKTESSIINEAIGAFQRPSVHPSTSNTFSSIISQAQDLPQAS